MKWVLLRAAIMSIKVMSLTKKKNMELSNLADFRIN
jgi:hypothetical protein